MDYFKCKCDNEIYLTEFLDDFNENLRIESLIQKNLPSESYSKHFVSYGIHEQNSRLKECEDYLNNLYSENTHNREPLGPCQNVLNIHDFGDDEQRVVLDICKDILSYEKINYDTLDPFCGVFFEHISPCDATLWVKYPTISPSHVHVRVFLIIKCSNSDPVRLVYNNTINCISNLCVCVVPSSIHAVSFMRHPSDILMLSIGVQMLHKDYISRFLNCGDNMIACIRNEKIVNARLKRVTAYHSFPSYYNIAFRHVEMFIPSSPSSLQSFKYNSEQTNMLEIYSRALIEGKYPTSYPFHNCLFFKSIPMRLIDAYLKEFIYNIFQEQAFVCKQYEVHLGVCMHGGCFTQKATINEQNAIRILVIERMSSNKLFLNGFLYNVNPERYYILELDDKYGFTSVIEDEPIIFMEIIGI